MIQKAPVYPKIPGNHFLTIVPPAKQQGHPVTSRSFALSKRIFDIVFSALFILAVMSWLVPLLSAVILAGSRGPVFFVQRRIGRHGKSFRCYKFRTMVPNLEADIKVCDENDVRITRTGRFLRKYKIDEFPQFLNVLAGSMTLVGPRPHMHADCRRFSAIINDYTFRHCVKPGITGLAQVKGYHGATPTTDSILQRFYWDNYYIRHQGWPMDAGILFRSIVQWTGAIASLVTASTFVRKVPGDVSSH